MRCSVEGCANRNSSGGLCSTHRNRLRRHGSVRAEIPVRSPGVRLDFDEAYACECERPLIEPIGEGVFAKALCCSSCHRPTRELLDG